MVEEMLAEKAAAQNGVSVRPLWEIAEEISSQVPIEEWEKLPTDGAEQHDHYLYGSPKRRILPRRHSLQLHINASRKG